MTRTIGQSKIYMGLHVNEEVSAEVVKLTIVIINWDVVIAIRQ